MNLKRLVTSMIAVLVLSLTGPVGAIFAMQATPSASPSADVMSVTDFPSTPPEYDRTDWPDKLTCGLFGGDDAEEALSNNEPLARYISDWIGIPLEYTTGSSYNAVIEAARAERVDCYTVGPFAYILGVEEADAEALAIGVSTSAEPAVYDESIQPFYYSVISTWKGSGIETIYDLEGRSFSFVDPASTSGHLIPETSMINAGMDPNDPNLNIRTMYAGSHPTSGLAIANHQVDAGATTENTIRNMWLENTANVCFWEDGETNKVRTEAEFKELYDNCPDGYLVPIFYSDPIPSTPFAINKNLPPSLKQAVKDALLSTPQNPEFIAETGRWFLDPTLTDPNYAHLEHLDSMYDPLREVAKALDLDLKSLDD